MKFRVRKLILAVLLIPVLFYLIVYSGILTVPLKESPILLHLSPKKIAIPPYANTTIQPYTNTTIQPYTKTTIQPYTNTTIQPYTKTTIQPYTKTTIQPYTKTTIQPYANTTIQPYANTTIQSYTKTTIQPYTKTTIQPYTNIADMYLLTMYTSFVDDPTNRYRVYVQSNYLRMSNFSCFRGLVKFVVFTSSEETTALINKYYPNVIAHPTPLYPVFNTPSFKDAYRISMKLSKSFFYMQANSCNLYESSLVLTLKAIKEAWMKGLIRQKIIIYGKRHDVALYGPVENEFQVMEYFKKAVQFRDDAQDYVILTKETIEFDLFSEVLMGRARSDNAMVDFGVHNEVESFDASNSIHLVHHPFDSKIKYVSESDFPMDYRWNHYVTDGLRDHYSTTCARYTTELESDNIVKIYDKKSRSVLDVTSREDNEFFKEHQYWIDSEPAQLNANSKSSPDLVVVILACNKPDSLNRLLNSLVEVDYEGDRIDLVISLDIGYLGFYDLPSLILIKKLLWSHGTLKLVLKDKHRGQLDQWIEAYSCVDTKDESPVLILEDNLQLSPFWYEYLKGVLNKSNSRQLQERIAGWSLEAPYPGQSCPKDSSVMLGQIRWIRSFVPVLSKWISFLKWYKKESKDVPYGAFSKSPASRLDQRGNWSNWESSMWVSWYWYYLKTHTPEQQEILYICDKRGSLASKTRISYLNWGGNVCFQNEGTLESEVNFQNIDASEKNHDIKISEEVPTFNFEPFYKAF